MFVFIPEDDDLPTPDDAEKATPTGAVQKLLSCQTQSDSGSVAEEEDTLIHAASNKPAAGENFFLLISPASYIALILKLDLKEFI